MALNFPPSDDSPWTAPNGVIYTWNTDGYWEAKADPADLDAEYLKLDASNDPVTGTCEFSAGVKVGGMLTGPSNFNIVTPGSSATGNRFSLNEQKTGNPAFTLNGKAIASSASNAINLSVNYNSTDNQTSTVSNIFNQFGQVVSGNQDIYHNFATVANQQNTAGKYVAYYSNLDANSNQGTGGSYNFYAEGSAPNYFNGNTSFGSDPTAPSIQLTTTDDNPVIHCGQSTSSWLNSTDEGTRIRIQNVRIHNAQTGRTSSPITLKRLENDNGHQIAFLNETDTTGYIENTADGGIIIHSNSSTGPVFVQNSDARVKSLTAFTTPASDTIKLLNPGVNGFIAHELQAHISDAVAGTQNETISVGTLLDWDGTELDTQVEEPTAEELTYTEQVETDGVSTMVTRTRSWTATGTRPRYQSVDQTKLIPLLTKALQEALTEIDTLKTRLSDAGIA